MNSKTIGVSLYSYAMRNEKKIQVPRRAKGIYLTATGTGVGKTYVSALILKKMQGEGLACAYYKPVMSGAERNAQGEEESDVMFAARAAGLPAESALVSYQYKTAVSPHLAARLEGNPPDKARITADWRRISAAHDFTVVEGAGGIVCPFRAGKAAAVSRAGEAAYAAASPTAAARAAGVLLQEDVIKTLGLPVLIVSGCALGSINSAVLTAAYLRRLKIRALGIVLNRWSGGLMEEDNRAMIELLTGLPVIAALEENAAQWPAATLF